MEDRERENNNKIEKILGYLLLGLVLGIIISGTKVTKI